MASLSAVMEAKEKFKTKFPKHTVGIGGSNGDYHLRVRVRTEDEVKKMPKEFNGVHVEVNVVGYVSKI